MNEAIIILGMHRSGTSCLTGCLKDFGLNLGTISEANPHNRKGNQENKSVFQLNEKLLNFNSGSWRNPPKPPLVWDSKLSSSRDQILMDYDLLPKPWGIKDPRMLLTYDFWEPHLPKHKFVGTFRHPLAVSRSLMARKHEKLAVAEDQALSLWKAYNEKLLGMYEKYQFPIVNFDLEHQTYIDKIKILGGQLSLPATRKPFFFDKKLINQSKFTDSECPPQLLDLYKKLLKISLQ